MAAGTVSRRMMFACALTCSPTACPASGDAARPGVHGHAPAAVDHRHLPRGLLLVLGQELVERGRARSSRRA